MLASAGGALSAMAYMWLKYGKPDPTMAVNGLLAGHGSHHRPLRLCECNRWRCSSA